MLLLDQHPLNKSIMIALLGRPNVGKSTLINALLGFDLTIVSHKPQTTRNQFHCAFTVDHTEVVLVDTPGIHRSNQELNKRMNGQAEHGSDGADINFLLFDLTSNLDEDIKELAHTFTKELAQSWVLFTKNDLIEVSEEQLKTAFTKIQKVFPSAVRYFDISAKEENNIHLLTGAICDAAKPGPHLYPAGHVSNKSERFFVSEYIREQAFNILRDELPYECAVTVEEFNDFRRKDKPLDPSKTAVKISATIMVNRPSQRAIVIGARGSIIKEIGSKARAKIETMIDGKVFLNLHVKVKPKWFKNNFVLEELGLPRVESSNRVWRAGQ